MAGEDAGLALFIQNKACIITIFTVIVHIQEVFLKPVGCQKAFLSLNQPIQFVFKALQLIRAVFLLQGFFAEGDA